MKRLEPLGLHYQSEKQYRSAPQWSQSRAKILRRGVNAYKKELEKKEDMKYSSALSIGTYVDWRLTREGVEEGFITGENVEILASDKPGGKVGIIVEKMLNGFEFEEAFAMADYSARYATDKNKAKVKAQIFDNNYYRQMLDGSDKLLLTEEDLRVAEKCYQSLATHEFTEYYCKKDYPDHIEALYQLQLAYRYKFRKNIFTPWKSLDLKAALDKVIIDHRKRTIMPIDFKTTGFNTRSFTGSFYKFGYDFQAAWYTDALKAKYPKYRILPYNFVVETTLENNIGCPLVYMVSPKVLKSAYKKVEDARDRIAWHQENGLVYDKEVVENKGLMLIK